MKSSDIFLKREGCPFCNDVSNIIIDEINYHDTAEANYNLPNIHGKLFYCKQCGISYPSHYYNIAYFNKLYQKSFQDLYYLDRSHLQIIRKILIKEIIRKRNKQYSFSSMLDSLLFHTLQVPYLCHEPRGLRILDVGCGFGEFSEIFQELGNKVVATDIMPFFKEHLQKLGIEFFCEELERINFMDRVFELIFMRATFYRTRNPVSTLNIAKNLLNKKGAEIALFDPFTGIEEPYYFFRKQFPQGQFYIIDHNKYLKMIYDMFGLNCTYFSIIYGKPRAPLNKVRYWENIKGLGELFLANLSHRRPYMMSYNLIL